MNYEKLKLLIPMNDLELSAQQQIFNCLKLPFLEKLVIMPDCHTGYLLPIGGVALLLGVISPEYVGYDIGCFVGDTKVSLPDGNDYTLKQLYDKKLKKFPVYSMDKNGNHKIGIADEVKLTRKNSKLVKIILDNDEEIICTPDHKFLTIDLEYIEAKDLTQDISLFPFHRYLDRDGYEYLGINGTSIIRPTHWVVAESGLLGEIPSFENGTQIHHNDKNKLNNFPDNLIFIDKIEHCKFHGKERNYFATDDFKKKKEKTISDRGYYFDKKFLEKKKEVATNNIKQYMSNNKEHFDQVVKDNAERGGKFFSDKNSDEVMKLKQKLGRIIKIVKQCLTLYGDITEEIYEQVRVTFYNFPYYSNAIKIINQAGFKDFYELINSEKFSNNHKIKRVVELDYTEDVYCMTVDKYHNFALSSGVFAHNCGMCTIITNLDFDDVFKNQRSKDRMLASIYKEIPVGPKMKEKDFFHFPEFKSASGDRDLTIRINKRLYKQLGTLGGGNHFIELGKDHHGKLGITIHSGSRNPGHTLAGYYMSKTKLNDMDLPRGFFHVDSEWGKMYHHDMNIMLDYALENRKNMMRTILDLIGIRNPDTLLKGMINENHNHAIKIDENRVLHRKGATESNKDQLGVIPGNMRDGVFIVKGLGNEEYLCSSSHGAGRKGSRTWAKETISLEKFEKDMKGITAKVNKNVLDESPDAYKDVRKVIKEQEGIVVNVINHISSIINVKDDTEDQKKRRKKKGKPWTGNQLKT